MTSSSNDFNSNELAQRKWDHILLAQSSQISKNQVDPRFNYEPLFFTHPDASSTWPQTFLGHQLDFPIWISSMTGGSEGLADINTRLAKLCGTFKLGMGLGSCRPLLESKRREDFSVRKFLGDQPLFANLGIAQIQEYLNTGKVYVVHEMVKSIEANGLIIHINPLQEWFQPEGDRYTQRPIDTIRSFLETAHYPVMVKEVGQGFGPKSLKALLEFPLAAIEFGAFGGTNFSKLEKLRNKDNFDQNSDFVFLGHTANEMIDILNALPTKGKEFIISGGVHSMLDGYALKSKLKSPSVIGLASSLLSAATSSYEKLEEYFMKQKESLLVAKGILELKETK